MAQGFARLPTIAPPIAPPALSVRLAARHPSHARGTRYTPRISAKYTQEGPPAEGAPPAGGRAWRGGRARRDGADFRRGAAFARGPAKPKEPLDAELVVLFGLPALIIVLPWALKDPAVLAFLPVALLVPGVRQVLVPLTRDAAVGLWRTAEYFKRSSRRRAGPPPPPPPGVSRWLPAACGAVCWRRARAGAPRALALSVRLVCAQWEYRREYRRDVYELQDDEFEVVGPGEAEEEEEEGGGRREAAEEGAFSRAYAAAAAAAAWGDVGTPGPDPAAAAAAAAPRGEGGGSSSEERGAAGSGRASGARAAGGGQPPRPRAPPHRRPVRGDSGRAVADRAAWEEEERDAAAQVLVRRGGAGRVGVDVPRPGRQRRRRGRGGQHEAPWYLQPLLSLFPFLRNWGGFM